MMKSSRPILHFTLLSAFFLLALTSCSHRPNPSQHSAGSLDGGADDGWNPSEPLRPKTFHSATELDKTLDAKAHDLPKVKPVAGIAPSSTGSVPEKGSTGGPWQIQIASLPDLESAETRKRQLDAKLAGAVELHFDAPYYKLRWGHFPSRQDAEDKMLELSEIIKEGIVVKP